MNQTIKLVEKCKQSSHVSQADLRRKEKKMMLKTSHPRGFFSSLFFRRVIVSMATLSTAKPTAPHH